MSTHRRHGKPVAGQLRSIARGVPDRYAEHRPTAVDRAHESAAHHDAAESAGARLITSRTTKSRAALAPRVFTSVHYIAASFTR